jgi:hypothetical protein
MRRYCVYLISSISRVTSHISIEIVLIPFSTIDLFEESSSSSDVDGKKVRVNEKVLKMTGETMLAGPKAEKLLGDSMTEQQKYELAKNELKERRKSSEEGEADAANIEQMNRKRLYERDSLGISEGKAISKKALELTGDMMLSSDKAMKLLGGEENRSTNKTIKSLF